MQFRAAPRPHPNPLTQFRELLQETVWTGIRCPIELDIFPGAMNRMLQPLESLMGQVLRNTKCRTSCRQYAALGPLRRSFHNTRSTREAETSAEASIVNPEYWREFKEACILSAICRCLWHVLTVCRHTLGIA